MREINFNLIQMFIVVKLRQAWIDSTQKIAVISILCKTKIFLLYLKIYW